MGSSAGDGAELDETKAHSTEFEGGPIVGRAELTEEDFREVWRVLPRNRRALVELVFSLLAIPVFWSMIAVLDAHGWRGLWSLPVVASSFMVGASLVFRVWRQRSVWARTAAKQMQSAEGVEFRFDSVGISLEVPGAPCQHEWGSLQRSFETAHCFVIYTTPTMVMAVPKRAFGANELTRLRARLLQVPKRELPNSALWPPIRRRLLLSFVFLGVFLAVWRLLNQS